ncbi:MAG TPA: DUF1287 domain-containing protein, partial [Xanthomonadaceae bacterium]|nr:DUF1287 domain-containing protein [Xanthomonadaceae bacterium]
APAPAGDARCLVEAARAQVGVTLHYDPAYRSIPYPDGDVPADRGVCTDVLVRAYRQLGHDLQALVHEDMRAAWDSYPRHWGLSRPDPNIDHRRVPNLAVFLSRHADVLPGGPDAQTYAAGDIVTWRLDSGVPHIGMVSDRTAPSGTPLVIHNIGRGTVEEDILFAFTITGHYRYLPPPAPGRCPAAEGVPASPPGTGAAPGTDGAHRPTRSPGAA